MRQGLNLAILLGTPSVLVILSGIAHGVPRTTPRDLDDIREAVLRYQFTHNQSMLQSKALVYYVRLEKDRDPSDAFVRRFRGNVPPVRKRSEAVIKTKVELEAEQEKQPAATAPSAVWVKDKVTGKPGIIFRVGPVHRLTAKRALVEGGYYEGGVSASGNTYVVEHRGHKWVVISSRPDMIS